MLKWLLVLCLLLSPALARAEFTVNNAIIEFKGGGETKKDIELANHAATDDYIVTDIFEILNPGAANEAHTKISDPARSGLLVTPDKMVLAGGSRKVMRFVLLREPDQLEHIYRVAIKPVVKGVDADARLGLKVLIGYEVLVIVRSSDMQSRYTAVRTGNVLSIHNTGNSNLLFQNGTQCETLNACKPLPVKRVYAGESVEIKLPSAMSATYSIWDGVETVEKTY